MIKLKERFQQLAGLTPKPEEVIDDWKEHTKKGGDSYNLDHDGNPEYGKTMYKHFCRRDGCGPAAIDFKSFAKNKYGLELKSPFPQQGFFIADKVVSGKNDFNDEMKSEFLDGRGDFNNAKERQAWVENSKYSEAWKYIPHYWLVDEKGNIYDPVGQEQFVDRKYAKDLNKNRYVEKDIEVK